VQYLPAGADWPGDQAHLASFTLVAWVDTASKIVDMELPLLGSLDMIYGSTFPVGRWAVVELRQINLLENVELRAVCVLDMFSVAVTGMGPPFCRYLTPIKVYADRDHATMSMAMRASATDRQELLRSDQSMRIGYTEFRAMRQRQSRRDFNQAFSAFTARDVT